jgi:nuclear pore complex protein Nup107
MISDDGAEEHEEHAEQESPVEDNEDILHPLREAANRVGQEVERFAQVLDQYNPLRAANTGDKHDMTMDLIDSYHEFATQTYKRLDEHHHAALRKEQGRTWRKKMRGFKIAQDEDEMDLEDEETDFPDLKTNIHDLERWEEEAQTWELLRRLVPLRFPHPNSPASSTEIPLHRYSTESEVWDSFLQKDDLALERKIVLDWLQKTADDSGDEISEIVKDLQHKADRGDVVAQGWLYTKHAIKQRKRTHTWTKELDQTSTEVQRVHKDATGTRDLVLHLDPDATTRQGRKLELRDEFFERSVWLGCYEMLRRGTPPAQVREWLVDRTEIWRAVSMAGFPSERDEQEEAGNPAATALWRRMCFALAKKDGGEEYDYERAVYGVLSGDLDSVLKTRKNWDDFIFAHYNALLRTQFDNYITRIYAARSIPFESFNAVQYHGDPKTAGMRIVNSAKTDEIVKQDALRPMKMLQGVLIANGFDHFIYQQGLAFSKLANENGPSILIPMTGEQVEEDVKRYIALDDHDSLRVVTHMLLIFISLGLDLGGTRERIVIENVIVLYVSFLRLAGKEELIPLYCSQLSGDRGYATLCRNLIDVTDHEQRQTQIRLMRDNGLDAQKFVKYQSKFLMMDHRDHEHGYPTKFDILEKDPNKEGERRVKRDFCGPEDVDRVDILMIRSLEWYLLVDGLWSETFLFGTMLYARFFSELWFSGID